MSRGSPSLGFWTADPLIRTYQLPTAFCLLPSAHGPLLSAFYLYLL
jgi:hypothetical protein